MLYINAPAADEAMPVIQRDLILLGKWYNMKRLTINCNKTKFCVYGMSSIVKKKSKHIDTILLSLNGTLIE